MGYIFTADTEKLIVTLDTEGGKFSEEVKEYLSPNLVLGSDRIFLKEDRAFLQDFIFEKIGAINGVNPSNLIDAYELLDALIKSIYVSDGNEQGLQETVDIDEVADKIELKLSFFDTNASLTPNVASGGIPYLGASVAVNDGIIFTGWFTHYQGVLKNGICKIFFDGTVDPSFNVGTGFNTQSWFVPMGVKYGAVSGKYYVVGGFTSYNGISANRIVRLNADGSIDNTFVYGTGFDNVVNDLAEDSLGRVVVVGRWSSYNGTSFGSSIGRIIRLTSTGAIDGTFSGGTGFSNIPQSLSITALDKIFVTGYFATYNGTASSGIVLIDTAGAIDASFVVGTGFPSGSNIHYTVRKSHDGKIYVAGNFATYKGVAQSRIVKLNLDGSVDATFVIGTGFNAAPNGTILKVLSDGKVLLNGYFTSYNGTPTVDSIILNTDGTIYRIFHTAGNAAGIMVSESPLRIYTIGADDDIYQISESGYFENERKVTFNSTTKKLEYSILGLAETSSQEILPKILIQELIIQLRKKLDSYTVATLPTAPTAVVGDKAYVTDATSPTYLGTLTGGGAVKCPVFFNGTIWVSA